MRIGGIIPNNDAIGSQVYCKESELRESALVFLAYGANAKEQAWIGQTSTTI